MNTAALGWIDTQHDRMVSLIVDWCNQNSGSRNNAGLEAMSRALQAAFGPLGEEMAEIALPDETVVDALGNTVAQPLGKAIRIRKRPGVAVQVLLCIHMDTVYGVDHAFSGGSEVG